MEVIRYGRYLHARRRNTEYLVQSTMYTVQSTWSRVLDTEYRFSASVYLPEEILLSVEMIGLRLKEVCLDAKGVFQARIRGVGLSRLSLS